MSSRLQRPAVLFLAISLAALPCASFSQATSDQKKRAKGATEKFFANYQNGVTFATDGSLPNGPCFRITGRVSGGDFFLDLKRFDYDEGDTVFRRGDKTVTEFPEQLRIEFNLHDLPCSLKMDQAGAQRYLTRKEIEKLRVSLYWKNGIELRPVEQISRPELTVQMRPGPAYALAEELPAKYEWFYAYGVASAGIPITDSLVVVMRTAEGNIAARFAARM